MADKYQNVLAKAKAKLTSIIIAFSVTNQLISSSSNPIKRV